MLHHHQPDPVPPRRVAILGASGFVARDLARHLLAEGIEHRAIGSAEIDLTRAESVGLLQAAVREDDVVVFTSGLTPDKGRDVNTLMSNLAMARHVAAFLESGRCSHVIYISSDAVYDGREGLMNESSTRQPSDLYSLMHIAREQIMAWATAKAGTPLCLLCPCAIYGAGDTHNSYGPNRFFHTARTARKITLFGQGEEKRDHIHVSDISRLIGLCLAHRSAGTINAATGSAVAFREVAERIAALSGPGTDIEFLPRSSPVTHRHFDVTARIKAFPSFVPRPLDEGLSDTWRKLTTSEPN